MNRLRYADVKVPIARVMNVCATDPSVMDYANEAERRLVAKGRWVGAVQRYQICVSSTGCFAWPRNIETIESYWICKTPGEVRSGWYESSVNGPGLLEACDGYCSQLIDRGTTATFDEIDGITSKVMVQSMVTELAGKRILLRGYDQNLNWIRTQEPAGSGNWIDGEWVSITTAAHYTSNLFTKITEAIKDVTNGPVYLWQYDTALGTSTKQLAYYEPDETLPIYRASLVPGLGNRNGCGGSSDSTCENTQITVIAKLRHIDVATDNDFFLLGNLGALKLMVMSILKEERNLFDEAQAYEAKALNELQAELNSYEGNGAVLTVKTESPLTWGAGGVLNPIGIGARVYF